MTTEQVVKIRTMLYSVDEEMQSLGLALANELIEDFSDFCRIRGSDPIGPRKLQALKAIVCNSRGKLRRRFKMTSNG